MCGLAYLSTVSIVMFLYEHVIKLLSLFSPIVVVKKGLSRRRAENVRLASQDVKELQSLFSAE